TETGLARREPVTGNIHRLRTIERAAPGTQAGNRFRTTLAVDVVADGRAFDTGDGDGHFADIAQRSGAAVPGDARQIRTPHAGSSRSRSLGVVPGRRTVFEEGVPDHHPLRARGDGVDEDARARTTRIEVVTGLERRRTGVGDVRRH